MNADKLIIWFRSIWFDLWDQNSGVCVSIGMSETSLARFGLDNGIGYSIITWNSGNQQDINGPTIMHINMCSHKPTSGRNTLCCGNHTTAIVESATDISAAISIECDSKQASK